MPKLTNSIPKYRHHKRSGQAVVTLGGIDVYLRSSNSKARKFKYINDNIDRIRRMFKWAVSEEPVLAPIPQALATDAGHRKERTAARDLPPVQPVPDSIFDATLPHLPTTSAKWRGFNT